METWLLGVIIRSARLEAFYVVQFSGPDLIGLWKGRYLEKRMKPQIIGLCEAKFRSWFWPKRLFARWTLFICVPWKLNNEIWNCEWEYKITIAKARVTKTTIVRTSIIGQATKGAGRMPWHQEPMKDVISCDKPRGAANEHWSVDFGMEKSGRSKVRSSYAESIGIWGEPPELKHLSRARKRNQKRFC